MTHATNKYTHARTTVAVLTREHRGV
eukprot:SAG25_NODE_8889_length_398_cov_0.926421_1_plen_25_part_10